MRVVIYRTLCRLYVWENTVIGMGGCTSGQAQISVSRVLPKDILSFKDFTLVPREGSLLQIFWQTRESDKGKLKENSVQESEIRRRRSEGRSRTFNGMTQM